MTLSEFTKLKQQIVFDVGKCENHIHILNKLKEFYKDDVDSDRRFEQINTIGQLINILEIRNVLSEDDVGPLKEIARRINNDDLLERICDYEVNHISKGYINQYVIENIPMTSIKQHMTENKESCLQNYPFGALSPKKMLRIRETIIEEIGSFWRDLGRNLKIRECKIDEIDTNYNSLPSKASQLMNLFESRADKQRWFFVLCEALEKSRRKDLSKTLQEIMAMNIS
ncbi:fas-associated death domain protein-like [Vanessa tameamea]|uniref:Fas-associated death domain protein-like n=1 Tax=Vanessa tameamea TaxID=334116 RepID=A0A8B8HM63_VANTA|nr:fas-associated death domain protein-like [Vanessa tameamea]